MHDCIFLDFGNKASQKNFESVKTKLPYANKQRFFGNFKGTLDRVLSKAKTEWCWITSSISNYDDFDFEFEINYHQRNHLHVFPANQNKEGDTLLINVFQYLSQKDSVEWLRDFETCNYHTQKTKRIEYPIVKYSLHNVITDLADACKKSTEQYFWYVNKDCTIDPDFDFTWAPSYWEDNKIFMFDDYGDVMLVPKSVMMKISEQMYDFDLIRKINIKASTPKPHAVIFISYDEPSAEERFNTLKAKCPRAKWLKNIQGQTEAYHAAARLSETDYFFAVFPKLEIVYSFNFDFQPDRLKHACHYIFSCRNPVNGLEYGHGSVLLYNKQLTLDTHTPGLDFTLSAPHEYVPILSAINHYNETPWLAWRTAFREVMKLKESSDTKPTVETKYRLKIWLEKAQGKNGEWSISGAKDASNWYDKNSDKPEQLMLSYDFQWLKEYYERKYVR